MRQIAQKLGPLIEGPQFEEWLYNPFVDVEPSYRPTNEI